MISQSLNFLSHKNIPVQLKISKLLNNKPKELNIWLLKPSKTSVVPLLRLKERPKLPNFSDPLLENQELMSRLRELKLPEIFPMPLQRAETKLT